MLNAAVEDWCEERLGISFADMHLKRRLGTPTVHIEADFMIAATLGMVLSIVIAITEVGRSSCKLKIDFRSDGDVHHLSCRVTLVLMDLDRRKSEPWPDDLRACLIAESDILSA